MSIDELEKIARRRRLDLLLVQDPANLRAATGLNCDNAILQLGRTPHDSRRFAPPVLYTDFRYVPMVHRLAPELKVRDLRRLGVKKGTIRRLGYESTITHDRYLRLAQLFPKVKFVDVTPDLKLLRAVKTPAEIEALKAAEKLNCEIWRAASARFRAGMTERQMAKIIQKMMIVKGEGEAFPTIISVGKNAAECHHEPDDTVWNGREPVLVDMGVRLRGVCSDLTRNLMPKRPRPIYRKVYDIVASANRAAIAAARPGMTAAALDRVARNYIRKAGFGKCFGHSLGHGVGYEIHESPAISKRDRTVLKPGMVITIEPGIYLEDNLGVRIEDMVLITDVGCEVLSN